MIDGMGICFNDMLRHIGQTVTVFTTSGGISGGGFTGVLISVDAQCIRLLTDEGAAPACPIGSSCTNVMTPCGMGGGFGWGSGWGNGCYGFGSGWGGFGSGWGWGGGCGGGCGTGEFGFMGGNPLGAVAVIPVCTIAAFVHHAI